MVGVIVVIIAFDIAVAVADTFRRINTGAHQIGLGSEGIVEHRAR